MVVEFGGKGNVATIIQQIRHELRQRGHQDAADLVHWYFPSIGEYATALEQAGFRVTFAQHYDRPTQLADQQKGIQDWIGMFGKAFFDGIPETEQQDIAAQVQEALRPQLFHDEHWFADYKRIRVVAIKE